MPDGMRTWVVLEVLPAQSHFGVVRILCRQVDDFLRSIIRWKSFRFLMALRITLLSDSMALVL